MKIKAPKLDIPEADVTPMIDIVFQLISFFMIITNFEQTQADERVKLPRDTLAKPPEVKVQHELVLNIGFIRNTDGTKKVPTPFVFYAGEQIPVLEFGPKLREEKRVFQSKRVDPKDVTVVLRADKEVPTGQVQELIKLAQTEGSFQKFALKAMQAVE